MISLLQENLLIGLGLEIKSLSLPRIIASSKIYGFLLVDWVELLYLGQNIKISPPLEVIFVGRWYT